MLHKINAVKDVDGSTVRNIGVVFLTVAIIIMIAGAHICGLMESKKASGDIIVANISSIETGRYRSGGQNRIEHIVRVSYIYEDIPYESEIHTYSSSMYVSKEVKISVNKDNPYDIMYCTNNLIPRVIFAVMAISFGGIGTGLIFLSSTKTKNQ